MCTYMHACTHTHTCTHVHNHMCTICVITTGKQQVKYLKCVLGCLLDTETILPERDQDTDGQLLTVLVHRLQTVLKQLMSVLTKKG